MVFAAEASDPIVGVIVVVVLFAITRPIITRVAAAEAKPWLVGILTASLALHLLCAPAQIFVVDHFYHGIADWIRYDTQGEALAVGFRHFDFALAPGHLQGIVNNGSVSIAAGFVFAIVGANQVAAFLVFAWLSFLGAILFFRAYTLTFPGADSRRYAYLLFFLPSLLFWTADVSKEAIMTLSLGVVSYGAAKVFSRRRGGYTLALLGVAIGILIRPNELLLIVAGFTVAMMLTPPNSERGEGIRRVISLAFFGTLLVVAGLLTVHYLHNSGSSSVSLNQIAHNNASGGSGGVGYSSSPLGYPHDVYVVLFDPLPFNFHGLGELLAAGENTLILIIVFASLRQLRIVPRAAFARPYVMMCLVYSLAFMYTFAALGNLGLITRERTLLFPFLLVLLCIPRSPKGQPPRYEWELRRRDRKRMRAAARGARPIPGDPWPARGRARGGAPPPGPGGIAGTR